MRYFLVLALLLAPCPDPASAGDAPSSKGRAHELAKQWDAGDRARVTAVAASEWPDPWIVALRLVVAGREDVARGIAEARDRPDVEGLGARLERWKELPASLLEAWDPIEGAFEAGEWAAVERATVSEALGPFADVPFLSAAIDLMRGQRLYMLGRRGGDDGLPDEGKLRAAVAHLEQALRAGESLSWRRGAATSCQLLGLALGVLGEDEDALEYWTRGAAIHDRRGAAVSAARMRANVGTAYHELGAYRSAIREFSEAAATFRGTGAPGALVRVLGNRAESYRLLGAFAPALADLNEALRILSKHPSDAAEAWIDLGLSTVRLKMGDAASAERHARAALVAYTRGKNEIGIASVEGTLGLVQFARGEYGAAIASFQAARTRFEAAGDEGAAARALNNLAMARGRKALATARVRKADRAAALAELEAALAELEAALALFRKHRDVRGQIDAYCLIGEFQREQGEFDAAEATLRRAYDLAGDADNAEGLIDASLQRALLAFARGRFAKAMRYARTGVTTMRSSVQGLSQREGTLARSPRSKLFDIGVRSAAAINYARDFYFFLESGRAGALLESLHAREAFRRAVMPKPLLDREDAARVAEALGRNRLQDARLAGDLVLARAARAELRVAQKELRDVFDAMERHNKAAAHLLNPPEVSREQMQRMQAQLRDEDAVVEYAFVQDEAFALVLTRRDARVERLGKVATIDPAAGRLARHMGEKTAYAAAEAGKLTAALVTGLKLKPGIRRLLVLPDGNLHLLPLRALAPQYEIAYVPSGSTLGRMATITREAGEGVLALGDPAYPQEGAATSRGGARLARLPASRDEVNAIGTHVLLGEGATEAALRDALKAHKKPWRSVHFACHGLVDAEHPMRSALAVTQADPDDGFITALDVLRMNVNADLVVLSACKTGRGRVYGGEGLLGFTSSFMVAGAPRLLVSLWDVDDKATQALMIKFYELWNPKDGSPGLRASEALAKAQDHVKKQKGWEHPYYWAAWVLWGLPD